ncbi:RNA 2',3'-cyclic phosphodiesterase [bacterium]|nr:RNA 2',3'-cyclic phosphodiesterase [bacterium]MBU1614855.1 RNA 2',3'-cyclic phosphodiesterase [bacterium]
MGTAHRFICHQLFWWALPTLLIMSQQIRTFIAIPLSGQIKEELSKLQEELKKSEAQVKWVSPEGIHLTLKFLGNVDEEKIREIEEAIAKKTKDCSPFLLSLGCLGVFPDFRRPRVVWVGVEEGASKVKELAKRIEKALLPLGAKKEDRPFSSHLTLGRVKGTKGIEKLKEILGCLKAKESGSLKVDRIEIIKSQLTPKGAIYTTLRKIIL